MTPVLLLVDLQNDYLERGPLVPPAGTVLGQAGLLLSGWRDRGLPVLHSHTLIRADLANRMPHWQRNGVEDCVAGTRGAAAPAAVAPRAGEPVFRKSHYSAFQDPALDPALRALGAEPLIVAGLYLHACIQASVLAAYERGYVVWIAADAVATSELQQFEVARAFLDGRAARFMTAGEILESVAGGTGGA